MRTFFVATGKRDKTKYPHSSDFAYELPIDLKNVIGVAIRDFKFANEPLINENNRYMSVLFNSTLQSTVTLTSGSYNNDINAVIDELNTEYGPAYHILFSLQNDRVVISINGSPSQISNIVLYPSPILRILGFPNGTGVCLYRDGTNPPAGLPTTVIPYNTSATAPNQYDVYNMTEMVVRITDVETIFSNDPVTDRCTAVLFNNGPVGYTVKQCADHYIPLLQVQSRLQTLRIKLLNMEGDLYDTIDNEAAFLIEFYCQNT